MILLSAIDPSDTSAAALILTQWRERGFMPSRVTAAIPFEGALGWQSSLRAYDSGAAVFGGWPHGEIGVEIIGAADKVAALVAVRRLFAILEAATRRQLGLAGDRADLTVPTAARPHWLRLGPPIGPDGEASGAVLPDAWTPGWKDADGRKAWEAFAARVGAESAAGAPSFTFDR